MKGLETNKQFDAIEKGKPVEECKETGDLIKTMG